MLVSHTAAELEVPASLVSQSWTGPAGGLVGLEVSPACCVEPSSKYDMSAGGCAPPAQTDRQTGSPVLQSHKMTRLQQSSALLVRQCHDTISDDLGTEVISTCQEVCATVEPDRDAAEEVWHYQAAHTAAEQ